MHNFGETNHLRELPALHAALQFPKSVPIGQRDTPFRPLGLLVPPRWARSFIFVLIGRLPKETLPMEEFGGTTQEPPHHGVIRVYFFSFCRSFTYQTFLYLLAGINISGDTGNCSRHQKPWRGCASYSSFPVRRTRVKKVLTQALEVLKKDSRIKLLFENRERDCPYSLQIKEEIHTIMMDHLEM